MSNIIKYAQVQEGKQICIGYTPNEGCAKQEVVETKHTMEEAETIILRANREAEAIIQRAQDEARALVQEASTQCEKMRQEKEAAIIEQRHLLEEETKNSRRKIEEESDLILASATKEKQALIESAEGEVVELICYLLEIIVGESAQQTEWIRAAVKKLIYREELQLPLDLYIGKEYTDEQVKQLEEYFLKTIGAVNVYQKDNIPNQKIEVKTHLGSMEYDITNGLDVVLQQMSTLRLLNKN